MMILSFDHFKRTYVIRSHTHEVCSETIKKNLPFQKKNDKWIIQDDNIHTFAHGHFGAHRWDIKRMWIFFRGQTMKNFSGLLKSRLTSKCSRTALWNRPWFQVNFKEVNIFKVNLKIKVDSKMCQKPHFI